MVLHVHAKLHWRPSVTSLQSSCLARDYTVLKSVDKITEATNFPAQPNKKAEQQHIASLLVLRSLFESFKSVVFISIPDNIDNNSEWCLKLSFSRPLLKVSFVFMLKLLFVWHIAPQSRLKWHKSRNNWNESVKDFLHWVGNQQLRWWHNIMNMSHSHWRGPWYRPQDAGGGG